MKTDPLSIILLVALIAMLLWGVRPAYAAYGWPDFGRGQFTSTLLPCESFVEGGELASGATTPDPEEGRRSATEAANEEQKAPGIQEHAASVAEDHETLHDKGLSAPSLPATPENLAKFHDRDNLPEAEKKKFQPVETHAPVAQDLSEEERIEQEARETDRVREEQAADEESRRQYQEEADQQ